MFPRTLHRLYHRFHHEPAPHAPARECLEEVWQAGNRREAQLDAYHELAEYYTRVER